VTGHPVAAICRALRIARQTAYYVPVEDRAAYLDVLEGPHTVRYAARIGDFKPLHSSAVGKALLGALGDAEGCSLLGRLELARVTPATITSRRALAADLAAGRERGWYVTRARTSLVAARQTLEAAR